MEFAQFVHRLCEIVPLDVTKREKGIKKKEWTEMKTGENNSDFDS